MKLQTTIKFMVAGLAMPMLMNSAGAAEAKSTEKTPVINGELEFVMCGTGDALEIKGDDLKKTLFTADTKETVIPVQSFDASHRKTVVIGGKKVTYIQVQFPAADEDEENIGWAQSEIVQARSKCPLADPEVDPMASVIFQSLVNKVPNDVSALDTSDCCTFPLKKRPLESFLAGMRQFGWQRPHNRVHAACDLYGKIGDPIIAIQNGVVLNGPVKFYQGTFFVAVKHAGGVVIRYGETLGRRAPGITAGATVKAGQVVGYMGKTSVPWPMLHFEMFDGSEKGPLTDRSRRGFQRRADLMNPTEYLRRWENKSF